LCCSVPKQGLGNKRWALGQGTRGGLWGREQEMGFGAEVWGQELMIYFATRDGAWA